VRRRSGFGRVMHPKNAVGLELGRLSAWHPGSNKGRCARDIELGGMLRIVGQHAW
jgi:hypothetical protein